MGSLHKCTALTFWPNLGTGIAKEVVPQIAVKFHDLMVYFHTQLKQGGVSHCGLAIYIKKYLKEKEELWKFKYFTMQKYNLLPKKFFKRNQNLSNYLNSGTNLKFQHKPKYHLLKILI